MNTTTFIVRSGDEVIATCETGVEICDFDLASRSVEPSEEKGEFLMLLEARKTAFGKRYFRMLVERWPGDLKGAAKEAGISLATLYRNLREYGIATKNTKP